MQKDSYGDGLPVHRTQTLPPQCLQTMFMCVTSAPVELKVYHRRIRVCTVLPLVHVCVQDKELALSIGLISALSSTVPCDDINTNVDTYQRFHSPSTRLC